MRDRYFSVWEDKIEKFDTDIFGLVYLPSFKDKVLNKADAIPFDTDEEHLIRRGLYMLISGLSGNGQFTKKNSDVLAQAIVELGDKCKLIFEIGTSAFFDRDGRRRSPGSTHKILSHKSDECHFITLDLIAKNMPEIPSHRLGTFHRMVEDSANSEVVFEKMQNIFSLQDPKIDLLFIDGHHSVDRVVDEWKKYIPMLSDHGVVLLHDTAFHPGPHLLVDAIDRSKFNVELFCEDEDYGITKITRVLSSQ